MAQSQENRFVTVPVLQRVAAAMLPFYRRIALDASYAEAWSRAVRRIDLTVMQRLFTKVVTAKFSALGTNGIGYFADFPAGRPILLYTNGTTFIPGTVQFFFPVRFHRAVAKAVLPLYRKIVNKPAFAQQIVRAIRLGDQRTLVRLVRSVICTGALRSIRIQSSGFRLGFRFPGLKHTLFNIFSRELTA
ncbi:MAG: hypothetical protein K0S39_2808 [Paenibacillus sp.]|jgi:hypothetical protein|nr:hypothetical protein [Paenibacillus sp.]